MNNTLKYGLLGAALNLVFISLLWGLGPERMASPWVLLTFLLSLFAGIIAAVVQRQEQGMILPFSQGIRIVFGAFALAFTVAQATIWSIMNYDPAVRAAGEARSVENMKAVGETPEAIQKALDAAHAMSNGEKLQTFTLYLALFLIFGFMLCLLTTAILRREPAKA